MAILVLFITACGNQDPQITISINPEGTTMVVGGQMGLSVDFLGPADVEFEWSTTAGDLSSESTRSVIFTAPDEPGPVEVGVKVTSGNQSVTDSISINVVDLPPTHTPSPTDTPPPTDTPTPTNTPTPTPTLTPSPTPGPIGCNNRRIVPGIFVQLADVTTSSFADSSGTVTFECEGVFDLFREEPPAVRIDYRAVDNSFAFFGIGISAGLDVSSYNEICVWVYAEDVGQRFDLKLESPSGGSGIEIFTTETDEWERHCEPLDTGYPDVDLRNISAITLSFNDGFGSAAIWVDDFELR
jgi:hypothetical protein